MQRLMFKKKEDERDELAHLVPGDGADVPPGHLPSHAEGGAVQGLQLDVQRGTEPI